MKSKSKNIVSYIVVIGLIAFALRFWNVVSIGDSFYANFLSDASTYRLWASKLASGGIYSESIFPMGPLYPYFLALFLKLGFSFYSVLFLQIILGVGAVINIYFISKNIFGEMAGRISGFMAAVYAPYVFYDGLLLSESLQIFLMSSALLLLVRLKEKKYITARLVVSGILIGLTALGRGTILFFPIFLGGFWLYKYFKNKKRTGDLKRALIVLAGVIIGILPASLHNLSGGDFVPISSNFGINFFIGNNSEATGAYSEPRGLNLSSDFTGRKIAEKESGRKLKSSEVSGFWSHKAFAFIKENPFKFIAGLANKVWIYLWNFDIPQAEAVQIHHKFSPPFWVLPSGFWFILVPGIIGMFYCKKDERFWILLLLFISSVSGAAIFFVIGRFKLLGSIALLIFAGFGIRTVYKVLKEKNIKESIRIAIIIISVSVILFLPRSIDSKSKIATAYDNVGIAYFYKNQPGEAIKWYRMAVEVKPTHSGALNNIGGHYYARQIPDSAIYYFQKSIEVDSTNDKPYLNIGRTFLNMGEIDSAYHYYQKAKSFSVYGIDADKALEELDMLKSKSKDGSVDPMSFKMQFDIAEKYAAKRQYDIAESYYLRALEIEPNNIRALNNLGFTYQAQSKFESAYKLFSRVIDITGGNAVAYNNIASVVYRMGMVDSALVLWEKALKFDPENKQIRKNIDFIRGIKAE